MAKSKQVPYRMTEADLDNITAIREHFRLPSDAAAVRYAVQQVAVMIQAQPSNERRPRKASS